MKSGVDLINKCKNKASESPTLQSWKCSDWMVSWIRWFSCGPTWTDGVEEDTSFKPSSTFLMLNFFIFSQTAEHTIGDHPHKIKRGEIATFSLTHTHTHTHTRIHAHALSLSLSLLIYPLYNLTFLVPVF